MNNVYHIDIKQFGKVDLKFIDKIFDECKDKIYDFCKESITEVYRMNSLIRKKENYVPLEEMLEAVKIETHKNPPTITIFIDEDAIYWRDKFGDEINEVRMLGEDEEIEKGSIVTSLDKYWKTPIGSYSEPEYIVKRMLDKIEHFLKNDIKNI